MLLLNASSASPQLRLSVPLESRFTGVVLQFAETSACACGLGQKEALAATLAVEEVFCFLAAAAPSAS